MYSSYTGNPRLIIFHSKNTFTAQYSLLNKKQIKEIPKTYREKRKTNCHVLGSLVFLFNVGPGFFLCNFGEIFAISAAFAVTSYKKIT